MSLGLQVARSRLEFMQKETPEEPREGALASGWTIEPADPAPQSTTEPAPSDAPQVAADAVHEDSSTGHAASTETGSTQLPSRVLVLLGVFGGLALLYAWVWLSWAQVYSETNKLAAGSAGALGSFAQQFVFWLAPLAPIMWFALAVALNRGRLKRMVLWVVVGAVVTLPLPFFSGVAV